MLCICVMPAPILFTTTVEEEVQPHQKTDYKPIIYIYNCTNYLRIKGKPFKKKHVCTLITYRTNWGTISPELDTGML